MKYLCTQSRLFHRGDIPGLICDARHLEDRGKGYDSESHKAGNGIWQDELCVTKV